MWSTVPLLLLLCSYSCAVASRVRKFSANGHAPQGTRRQAVQPIVFNIDHEGRYNYTQGNETWLLGAPLFLSTDGQNFTTENGSMKLQSLYEDEGTDEVGQWRATCFWYLAGVRFFQTCAKTWVNPQLPITVFQQIFMDGTSESSTGNPHGVISGFPSFQVPRDPTNLAYFSLQGTNSGQDYIIGRWQATEVNMTDGLISGPIAVFDQNGAVIIISPFSGFMSASSCLDSQSRVSWGIMSGVDSVPVGYQYETIVYWGYQGINQAFADWGRFMRSYYNKDQRYRKADLTLNYLGYWTAGGSYYFKETEPGKNYEQTLFDIKSYADSVNLPYRYIQYDSWFYPKDQYGGVLTWTPMPTVAPDGFQYVFNRTQWPVFAHSRWWSPLTPYAKQNGGNFNFILEKECALPQNLSFWMYLFEQARPWGLIVYEQGWSDRVFLSINASLTSVDVARTWLMQVGEAALAVDITVHYCSAGSRFALQSLEIPAVTQVSVKAIATWQFGAHIGACGPVFNMLIQVPGIWVIASIRLVDTDTDKVRVTNDYRPDTEQWKIGVTSIFPDAMGVAPFKDNFWTGRDQPGNTYNLSEPYGELQAAVATLSTAPVGPGDMIGHTEVAMLMQCCRSDGKILQPDKPAMAIDREIWQAAWPGTGPAGEVWSTYSQISPSDVFGIILAAEMNDNFVLSPSDAGFDFFDPGVVMTRETGARIPVLSPFSSESPVIITPQCTRQDFCMYYTSPVYNVGVSDEVVIYGEEGKFVPMSRDRVQSVDILSDSIELVLQGSAGEPVTVGYFWNNTFCRVTVLIEADGTAVARLTSASCPAQ